MKLTFLEKPENVAIVDHYNEQEEDMELPLFGLSTIASATDNFSISNKLGGGFGPVYKFFFFGKEKLCIQCNIHDKLKFKNHG